MKRLNPVEFIRSLSSIVKSKAKEPDNLQDNPVLNLLLKRRTVRSFSDQPISEEIFRTIIEAARLAPCAVNLQSWTFGLFDRNSWEETFDKKMPFGGDRAVIILGDAHRVRKAIEEFPFKPLVEYTLAVTNAGIAAYAMNIAAEAYGIGSVMLSETGQTGFYNATELKERLGLPDGVFPLMTIVFGHPKNYPTIMPPKLPVEEITFTGRYKEPDSKVMQDWLHQMIAGYRAKMITASFNGQLRKYLSKIDEAEAGLRRLIFYREEEFKKGKKRAEDAP